MGGGDGEEGELMSRFNCFMGFMVGLAFVWNVDAAERSLAPVTPEAPAGIVQIQWSVEAPQGALPPSVLTLAHRMKDGTFRFWLNGEGAENESPAVSYGTVTMAQAAKGRMKMSGETIAFLPNLAPRPTLIKVQGFLVQTTESPVEVRVGVSPRDSPVQTVSEGGITHFGVYQVNIQLTKDKKGKWHPVTALKLLRAAEPDDQRYALKTLKAALEGPLSELKAWAPRMERALNPPSPPQEEAGK